MYRTAFFWVAAIAGALFGLLMFFSPGSAATAFNVTSTPLADALFRVLGATLLGLAFLNVMVRSHAASETLTAILWANVAVHVLGSIADLWSVQLGALTWASIAPGLVVHIVILVWGAWLALNQRKA
ncbi:MAG: hypothetical protein ABIO40_10010 [Devosia sp.]